MEFFTSDITLVAAGLAGLGMTTIAIYRDVSASRSRMILDLIVSRQSAVIASAA